MANRLAGESSPYLLQHQNNPVDWYPWGSEALERSRREEKPIFLSIGYSACHWCHVMEHESFEDAEIARYLNQHFVCIKVDREERPDLDHIYMTAVQLLTGRGGWPMSVFLTPSLKPFYGGTYWPPRESRGMAGFLQVLSAVVDAWTKRRAQVEEQSHTITKHISEVTEREASQEGLRDDLLNQAAAALERAFDFTYGGFGSAPKFPHPMDLDLILRVWSRVPRSGLLRMVELNLQKMAQGGIYDHLGGGFARYSVDERWLVPHFEKMLYDNALLVPLYLDAWLITGNPVYAQVVRETCNYVLTTLTDSAGGFHSTEDADSEGEEGKFYVWTPAEIRHVLGNEAGTRFCEVYDVTSHGNFEGHNILNLPQTIPLAAARLEMKPEALALELADSRAKLLAARNRRVRPGKDDKVLVNWNGLMIHALARAGAALIEPRYLAAAKKAADFLLTKMRRPDGRLLHSYRQGKAKFDAYLDDYACLANGLVSLYEATCEERWIDEGVALCDTLLAHFQDRAAGGFFFTADDHEELIARHKDLHDASVPSGNGMAATALIRMARLLGSNEYLEAARQTLEAGLGLMEQSPIAAGQLLIALDLYLGPTPELAVVGDPEDELTKSVLGNIQRRYWPRRALACRADGCVPRSSAWLDPFFDAKTTPKGEVSLYVCQNFSCQAPIVGTAAIGTRLDELAERPS